MYLSELSKMHIIHSTDREPAILSYLLIYALILLINTVVFVGGFLVFVRGSLEASRKIHARLVQSILGTTLRFLDKTPVGRIIARFTRDVRAVDGSLNSYVQDLTWLTTSMLLKLLAVVFFSPVFLAPGIAFALVGGLIGQIYIKAQLSVKRLVNWFVAFRGYVDPFLQRNEQRSLTIVQSLWCRRRWSYINSSLWRRGCLQV